MEKNNEDGITENQFNHCDLSDPIFPVNKNATVIVTDILPSFRAQKEKKKRRQEQTHCEERESKREKKQWRLQLLLLLERDGKFTSPRSQFHQKKL